MARAAREGAFTMTLFEQYEEAQEAREAVVDDQDDQEEAYEGVTVGECNDFRNKCMQSSPEDRDLIMRGLFDIDQQGRRNEYGNAELRKASMMDLYGSLNEAHQEQIRRYAKLLLENQ